MVWCDLTQGDKFVLFLCFQALNTHPSQEWKKILNPSKSETKSYSIFHSSTCYECVHFNKKDHLPQNSRLLTSPAKASIRQTPLT